MRIRLLVLALAIPLILIILGSGGIYLFAKRAEPRYTGTQVIPGLHHPVRVRFSQHAVPTIEAADWHDLLFTQGFIVAGERMWQMDLLRRLASGRLAEIFGPNALATDRLFRTIGLAQEAKRSLDNLEDSERDLLLAYAAGVNAYQESARGQLPLEYQLANFTPEPWRPEDSLVIGGYLGWSQSYNARAELVFLRLALKVGPERAREFFPTDEGIPAPELAPEMIQYLTEVVQARRQDKKKSAQITKISQQIENDWPLSLAAGAASNAWVVTGARSVNGEAMLANDPHLASSMPGIWYELELSAPGLHVAGAAVPGVPLVLIGHNEQLAWGITTAIADTQDIFIEKVTSDGQSVEREGSKPEPIQTTTEWIPVKSHPAVDFSIRHTSHGVIINNCLEIATGHPLDLTGLAPPDLIALRTNNDVPDQSFSALLGLSQAKTLDAARTAALGFKQVALNIMFAHRDGGIAWQITGALPHRGRGTGAFPLPGWLEAYDWQGLLPQASNPNRTNPPNGVLITANQRTIPIENSTARLISNSWMAPYRAQRIAERLTADTPLTADKMSFIQGDTISLMSRLVQRDLRNLEHELRANDPDAWEIAGEWLLNWDGEMQPNSRSAAFFALFEPEFFHALYGDELGADLDSLMELANVAYNPVQETFYTEKSSFWDDINTPELETPEQIWARALRVTLNNLRKHATTGDGINLAQIRTIKFPHAFDRFPWIGAWFSPGPFKIGGNADTINVLKTRPQEPENGLSAPTLRVVATPADWSQTRGTLPLGQSGHRFSLYRTDQFEDWRGLRTHPWPWNGPPSNAVMGTQILMPEQKTLQH